MKKISRRKMIAASSASLLMSRAGALGQGRGGRGGTPAATATSAPKIPDVEWRGYANDVFATFYSPLDQINGANFSKLEIAWRVNTNLFGPSSDINNECTPVVGNGRLFISAGVARDVAAFDASNGELLWVHRYDEGERHGSRTGSGRGVAYWSDGTNERIFYVTPGYQLFSLDAKTGLRDPDFGKNGMVDLRLDDDQEIDLLNGDVSLHATPLVAGDVLVVGAAHTTGGSPRSRKAVKGYTRGFDIRTGKRLWIFHTIPKKGEFGYDTWLTEGQADITGNTGVWGQMSADPALNTVYIPVEMPTGDTVGIYRKGPGLFGESVVALDLHTGQRKWHFQLVHHGLWDYDPPCAPIIFDAPINGRITKCVAQPTKQAFLYVFNRETGEPIWPIPELPVPAGNVPGEWYSPTQPHPTKPPAYDRHGVTEDVLADWTPEIRARAKEVASHYLMGPIFTPPLLFPKDGDGPWATLTMPGLEGGSNWPGASYDPETHIMYLFSQSVLQAVAVGPNPNRESDFELISLGGAISRNALDSGGRAAVGAERGGRAAATGESLTGPIVRGDLSVGGLPLHKPPYGRITAMDMSKGEILWVVPHGETPDAIRHHPLLKGMTIPRTGQSGKVGTLTTKTLVISGDSGVFTDEQGRKAARLRAYDKATGEEKGAVFIPGQATGTPMTYARNGRQYIVLAVAAAGGGSEFWAFRLPENA